MESMIALAGILFILSMINERIVNFIKLQFSEKSLMGMQLGNLKEKKSRNEEDDRNKRIILLNIITGTIVCLMIRVDLISMMGDIDQPARGIGWEKFDRGSVVSWITLLPGCFLTGCFLSLGSKFWHDLLDLLLYTKDMKGKLVEQAGYVDAAAKYVELQSVNTAVEAFKQQVVNIKNVTGAALNTEQGAPRVDVYVNEEYTGEPLIPKKVFYPDMNNVPKSLDVHIVTDFNPKAQSDLWPAGNILNQDPYPSNRGSVGGRVYDARTNAAYFISCFHVVKSPLHKWDFKANGHETVLEYRSNEACGEIVDAIRDDEIDAAIMKTVNDYQIRDGISGIGSPHFVRDLTMDDKKSKTRVRMFGGISQKLTTGYISDIGMPAKILYYRDNSADMEYHRLNKLIFIKSDGDTPFSLPGDSGSMVVDEYDYLIGILVGGQGTRSFVIPITTVFYKLGLKLHQS